MSFCEFEQNENDAAIISSLLFLMDSNREVRPEDHNTLRDINQNNVDNLHYEQANNQSIIESTRDNVRKSAKAFVGTLSHLSSSVESPGFGGDQDFDSQSVDAPLHSANGELRSLLVSQTNQISLQVAICSEDKDQGRGTVRRNESGNPQKVFSINNIMSKPDLTLRESLRIQCQSPTLTANLVIREEYIDGRK